MTTRKTCSKCGTKIRKVRIGKNPYYWGRKKDGTRYPRPGELEYYHAYRLIPIRAMRPRIKINLAAGFSPQGPAGVSAAMTLPPAGPLRINLRLNRAGACAAWNANTLRQHTGAIVLSGGCRIRQWVRSILALIRAVPASGAKHPGRLQCRRRHSRGRFLIGGLLRLHQCRRSTRPQAPAPIEFQRGGGAESGSAQERKPLWRHGGAVRLRDLIPTRLQRAEPVNTRPASPNNLATNTPGPGDTLKANSWPPTSVSPAPVSGKRGTDFAPRDGWPFWLRVVRDAIGLAVFLALIGWPYWPVWS